MADEVKWGRVRAWDGSKGCPPVAEGRACAIYFPGWQDGEGETTGDDWDWESDTTAYRIPAEFDHLDDNGNPADPFAGHTSAELRAAADAKDDEEAKVLGPWFDLLDAVNDANRVGILGARLNAASILRDGAAKLLGSLATGKLST